MLKAISLLLVGVLVCRANVILQNTSPTQQGGSVQIAQSPFVSSFPVGFPSYGVDDDYLGLPAQGGMPFYGGHGGHGGYGGYGGYGGFEGYGGVDDDFFGYGRMGSRAFVGAGAAPAGLSVGQVAAIAIGSAGTSAPTGVAVSNPVSVGFNPHAAAPAARVQSVAPVMSNAIPAKFDHSGRTSVGVGHATTGVRNSVDFERGNSRDGRFINTGSAFQGSPSASFGHIRY
ncbi:hypothetical protein ACJMK2_013065 [Sinanodonta woodiana]|uniref:Uncharacterized protein n=1 Tax=Sinanodonta woodiana TaxID=1069815 RepID=A0ABD3VBC2_SINWO